jgi:hypothetical protein
MQSDLHTKRGFDAVDVRSGRRLDCHLVGFAGAATGFGGVIVLGISWTYPSLCIWRIARKTNTRDS